MCTKKSICYEKYCNVCKSNGETAVYYGETGKNMFSRELGHLKDIRSKDKTTPLVKHSINVHNDIENIDFTTKITKSFKSALERGNNEGIKIRESKANYILNSRSEFIQPALVRQKIHIGNY